MSAEIKGTELAAVENAVVSMNKLTAGLAALSTRFKDVIFDVTTSDGMAEAKAARKEIAGPRIEVEKIRKAAKAPILELGRKLDAEATRITKELEALEDPIDQQIKTEEDRITAERQARLKAEQDRVAGIRGRIADMESMVGGAARARTAADVKVILSDLEAIQVDDSFAELAEEARSVQIKVQAELQPIYEAALSREAEAARVAAERAELDRQRAEQDERTRKAREEQARIDTINGRISAIRGHVEAGQALRTSAEIGRLMVTVSARAIGPVEFGELMQDACQAQLETMNRLQALHIAAKDREAEQARLDEQREAQAAEQRRLDQERAEFEARQSREREEQETRAKAEREAVAARARKEEEDRVALASSRMDEIMSMGHQVMIATGGRLGVRVGGTRQCIVDTLEETKAWLVTEGNFGSLTETATKAKHAAVEKIVAILKDWDDQAAEAERLRNYVPTLAEMLAVLADHYERDAEVVEDWLRKKLNGVRVREAAKADAA